MPSGAGSSNDAPSGSRHLIPHVGRLPAAFSVVLWDASSCVGDDLSRARLPAASRGYPHVRRAHRMPAASRTAVSMLPVRGGTRSLAALLATRRVAPPTAGLAAAVWALARRVVGLASLDVHRRFAPAHSRRRSGPHPPLADPYETGSLADLARQPPPPLPVPLSGGSKNPFALGPPVAGPWLGIRLVSPKSQYPSFA